MRTSKTLTSTVLVLVLTGLTQPVFAGNGTAFKGKTEQGSKVTFSAKSKKVVGFKTSASALCLSGVTGRSILEWYPVLLQSPTPLKKGKFKIVYAGPSSSRITVKAKITGNKAVGSLDVAYTKTMGYLQPYGTLDIGACSANTTWTAKKK